jgi:para-aminobenzoate synthetase/4-amino-4-deoxychorismate lyase
VAVAEAVERIAAGEVFQANICLRLQAGLDDAPLDLWRRGVAAVDPAYAAFVGGDERAVASLSPELFLRRRGREVRTEPIKGTAPRDADPASLLASDKDQAENVMIVDLMRNDLGRVCAYGSVRAEPAEVLPAAGVWHLVGAVSGTLREGATDADLVRAAFPPGSVTGAPKVRAQRVIADLEATAREAYCGAIGFASPLAGLELNVAIRTLECAGGRVWLGVGGGIVAQSTPEGEVAEALAKARPVLAATGLDVAVDEPPSSRIPGRLPGRRALAGDRARPDPARGLLETILVVDGQPVALDAHLARLDASARALGLRARHDAVPLRALAATAPAGAHRLRLTLDDAGPQAAIAPAPKSPAEPIPLEPVVLPGGLGAHKWADRTLLDELATELAATALLVDLDGHVLEAAHAGVLLVEDDRIVVPPQDGRALPSISQATVLKATTLPISHEPVTLERARRAAALILTSALRGPHPGLLPGGQPAEAAARWCDRLAEPQLTLRPRP